MNQPDTKRKQVGNSWKNPKQYRELGIGIIVGGLVLVIGLAIMYSDVINLGFIVFFLCLIGVAGGACFVQAISIARKQRERNELQEGARGDPALASLAAAQTTQKAIITMKGVSELLEVYTDKIAITPHGVMGFLAKGFKGTKTILFHSITAIQFKKAGLTGGYLQFTIPGGRESLGGVFAAASDENSFMFGNTGNNNEQAQQIKNYIESRVQETRAPKSTSSNSVADELQKLASLRRDGILSDEEFNSAKKRLLGT